MLHSSVLSALVLQIKGNAEFFEGAPSTGDVLSHLGRHNSQSHSDPTLVSLTGVGGEWQYSVGYGGEGGSEGGR